VSKARDADVIVVGGGAMGSAAAWQLAARGAEVLLLERFEPGHTNGASHGASRIFRLSYPDPAHIALARQARDLWRSLEQATGTELLTVTGGVDHGGDPRLEELHAGLSAAGIASEWLGPAQAEERWPGIRIDTHALYHPDSGRLHADRSVEALQSAASALGASVQHTAGVTRITVIDADTVEVGLADGRTYRARRAVIAAGAWTRSLLAGLVPLPSLRVTQEQPAHFVPLAVEDGWPSFGHLITPGTAQAERFHGGVYGLATPGEGIKVGFHGVGPEVDPDRRDFRPRAQLATALDDYVRTWLPGLDPVGAVAMSCTYTTTPDSLFVLDRHGPLVLAAGFSGHGFKFVPAIGRVLAELAIDGIRPDPIWSLDRFATLTVQPS
jgi:sarcosine oxidase